MRFMFIVTSAHAGRPDAGTAGGDAQARRPGDQGRPHARQWRADAARHRARRCASRTGSSASSTARSSRPRRSSAATRSSNCRARRRPSRRRGSSCSSTRTSCRAGKGRASFARSPALEARPPTTTVGGHDGRRRPSRDPRRLADRAAPADHQPGEDAARCAAGRGSDAGSAGRRARAVAGDGRAGKTRRLADGDRQAPGPRSFAPRPDARAQARDDRLRHGGGAAGHARSGLRPRRRHRR